MFNLDEDKIYALEKTIAELRAELERERMRLAACGVAALSNTAETAAKIDECHDDYKSASLSDVQNAIQREMKLRTEIAKLRAENAELKDSLKGRLETGTMLYDKYLTSEAKLTAAIKQLENLAQALKGGLVNFALDFYVDIFGKDQSPNTQSSGAASKIHNNAIITRFNTALKEQREALAQYEQFKKESV